MNYCNRRLLPPVGGRCPHGRQYYYIPIPLSNIENLGCNRIKYFTISSLSCSQYFFTLRKLLVTCDVAAAQMSCWKYSVASSNLPFILTLIFLYYIMLMFVPKNMFLTSTSDQKSKIISDFTKHFC